MKYLIIILLCVSFSSHAKRERGNLPSKKEMLLDVSTSALTAGAGYGVTQIPLVAWVAGAGKGVVSLGASGIMFAGAGAFGYGAGKILVFTDNGIYQIVCRLRDKEKCDNLGFLQQLIGYGGEKLRIFDAIRKTTLVGQDMYADLKIALGANDSDRESEVAKTYRTRRKRTSVAKTSVTKN